MHIDINAAPPTIDAISAGKKHVINLCNTTVVLTLIFLITAYTTSGWVQNASLTCLALFMAGVVCMGSFGFRPFKSINGSDCYRVSLWLYSSPRIATYVSHVKEQRRELVYAEFDALRKAHAVDEPAYHKQQLYKIKKD